jgi:hypothetical protein
MLAFGSCVTAAGRHPAATNPIYKPTKNAAIQQKRTHLRQVSYRFLPVKFAVPGNLVCLFLFMLVASYCLWKNLRRMQSMWAEALLSPKGTKLRCGFYAPWCQNCQLEPVQSRAYVHQSICFRTDLLPFLSLVPAPSLSPPPSTAAPRSSSSCRSTTPHTSPHTPLTHPKKT